MNTTSPNNITITDARRRRTSISSTASTRSSWRVPLAKQPPRTQLSAVFAESEAPSLSPSNRQSALSLLEARYGASSSVSSTLSMSSSLSTRIRPGESPLEETLAESLIITNAMENESLRRGRQATQRNISPAGAECLPAHPHTEQSDNIRGLEAVNTSPSITVQPPITAQNCNPQMVDWQPTANTEVDLAGEQRKRKQSSMSSGWFGTSGRSKAQKVAPVAEPRQQQDVSTTASFTFALTVEVPVAKLTTTETKVEAQPPSLPPTNNPEEKPTPASASNMQPSSSGWFSRSRVSTPAPAPPSATVAAQPDPISQTSPTPNASAATPIPTTTQVPVSAAISIATNPAPASGASPAPSPSRASWFGSRRGRSESVAPTPPTSVPPSLYARDTSMSTPQTPSRVATMDLDPEPPSAMSASITDESMTATITPMTFAEAQARSNAPRAAGPQSWFKMGGKRESMTPSVDSRVPSLPSLPPSPRSDAPPLTTLVPISHPSVSSLGSSTARYTLSFPLLGKPKVKLEDALKEVGKDALQNPQATAPAASLPSNPIPEISAEMMVDSPSQATSSAASISSRTSAQPPPSSPWWGYFGRPTVPVIIPQDSSPPATGALASPESIPPTAATSTAASSVDGQRITTLAQQTGGNNVNDPLIPDNASWFGLWSWGNQAPPAPGSSERPELKRGKTEAELVKEEAMARDQNNNNGPSINPPLTSTSTVMPDLPTPRLAELSSVISGRNPISEDSVDNRASWTSFFSLRAAYGAKRVTMQEELEDVMDLDGDPDAPAVASVTAEAAPAKGHVHDVVVAAASTPPSKSTGRSSSTEPSGSRENKTTPNLPLTDSGSIRRKVITSAKTTTAKRSSSATPSKRSLAPPAPPKASNMVLPTFGDTFYTLPRALPPYSRSRATPLRRIMSGMFGIGGSGAMNSPSLDDMKEWQSRSSYVVPKDHEGLRAARDVGRDLPRTGGVLGIQDIGGIKDCKRVAIVGIHGWFPGTIMRTLLGEPTGTSPKFAAMMETAVLVFMEKQGVTLEKVTSMPLEGDGTIERRVEKLYEYFLTKKEWIEDLHEADVIFVATHSQGSVVSTQLLDRLIADGHIRTAKNWELVKTVIDTSNSIAGMGIGIPPTRPPQRICCLALCGIHLGPLLYLGTSSFVNPYIQYFESAAARELFEFQDTETEVSKRYIASLESVLDHGVKFVYVASLDDQVVPIYSGLFTNMNHPRILRALYIDGDAYSSSDFLSNLLVLLIRMRNAGIDDGGLLTHLSEATAGSLSGVGHSTAYLDPGAYQLAVRYLFETSDALGEEPRLEVEAFTAKASRNDYEIPWALRGLIGDPRCQELFGKELMELRSTFDDWHPRTSAMREVRKKLEPIRGRRSRFAPDPFHHLQSPLSTAPSASPTSTVFTKTNNC